MNKIILFLLFSSFLFAQEKIYSGTGSAALGSSFTDSMVTSTSIDTMITTEMTVGQTRGDLTLVLEPTLNSGTATAVTVAYKQQVLGFSYGAYQTVATLSAADITAGTVNLYNLSILSTWKWCDYITIRLIPVSGSFNVDVEYEVRGQ